MSNQQHPQTITGDHIGGDKFTGDKIAGNKIETETYIARQVIVQGVEITDLEQLPSEVGEPPYKGLAYFTAADHEWFFGREKMTAILINRLHDLDFLAVIGDSGSGKSSLVRAGVIPVMTRDKILDDGTVPPLGEWRVEIVTPTAHPLAKLATALFPDDHSQQAILQEGAAENAHTLHDALAAQRKPGHKLLLFVDQFEELFTLCEKEEERQAFINNLLTLAESSADCKVVITLRADFYAQCLRYEGMRQVLKTNQEPLGAMNSQELAAAILEPAAKGKWQFQAGLVEEILDDLGEEPGRLPLLSHALLETWQRRRGRILTLSGYQEAGKIRGAIAQTADAVYKTLDDNEQKIAQRIFMSLTELGAGTQDTRRRVSQSELGGDAAVKAVTKMLTDARLVTASKEDIDVSHEALIREWPRLRGWLNINREELLMHRRLASEAKTWKEEGQDSSYLYTGSRLGQAKQWAEANGKKMNAVEKSFLAAAQKQHNKRRIQQVGIPIMVLIFSCSSFFFLYSIIAADRAEDQMSNQAALDSISATATAAIVISTPNAQYQATIANQLAIVAQAEIKQNPELALLLATAGLGLNNQSLTQAHFYNAIFALDNSSSNEQVDRIYSAVFDADGKFVLSVNDDSTADVWDIYPTLQNKVEVAQEHLSRGFTDAECTRFFSDDRDSCPQTVEAVFALFEDDLAMP